MRKAWVASMVRTVPDFDRMTTDFTHPDDAAQDFDGIRQVVATGGGPSSMDKGIMEKSQQGTPAGAKVVGGGGGE